MSNFTITLLTGERVLVQGTDVAGTTGTTVLDGSQWNQVKAHKNFHAASEEFDAAVEEFFAPLMEAQAKLEATTNTPAADESSYIVLSEGVEQVKAQQAEVVHLHQHSVILRLIEEGKTDRLIWVNDTLEVTASGTVGQAPKAPVGQPYVEDTAVLNVEA